MKNQETNELAKKIASEVIKRVDRKRKDEKKSFRKVTEKVITKVIDMKELKLFDENGKVLIISDIIRNVYFDIPDNEMSYAVYTTKAYFDENGWFLIDCDGNKQYEDEKWLKVSSY